jgi:hypothetical protein
LTGNSFSFEKLKEKAIVRKIALNTKARIRLVRAVLVFHIVVYNKLEKLSNLFTLTPFDLSSTPPETKKCR